MITIPDKVERLNEYRDTLDSLHPILQKAFVSCALNTSARTEGCLLGTIQTFRELRLLSAKDAGDLEMLALTLHSRGNQTICDYLVSKEFVVKDFS